MGWNGLDLQNEFAALLGDTTTAFKSKVMGWINDIEMDIYTRHDWPFSRHKGQVKVTESKEEQSLIISAPSIPTVALDSGGSLTQGSSYTVKIAYFESESGVESFPCDASASVTTDAINKKILLSSISVSTDPLVTNKRIYLSKDGGTFYLYQSIANATTTATIDAETTSLVEPSDFDYIKKIEGSLFIESSTQLRAISAEEMRNFYPGNFADTSGTPTVYSVIDYGRVLTYPKCNIDTVLSFYFFKNPRGVYASVDSTPGIPRFLKEVLAAGVEWKGYQYRDRSGKTDVFRYYNDLMVNAISRMGRPDRQSYTVRDVVGDADGFVI